MLVLVTCYFVFTPLSPIHSRTDKVLLPDPIFVEYLTRSDIGNNIEYLEKTKWKNQINDETHFFLRFPYIYGEVGKVNKKEIWGNQAIQTRVIKHLKKYDAMPALVAEGKHDDEFGLIQDGSWDKLLQFSKEKKDHQGFFYVQENKENEKFELEFIPTNLEITKNRNLNLVVISYFDWANLDAENGERTYRYVAREFPFGPEGMPVGITKEGISKPFILKSITEENRKQSGFVIFLQDMTTYKVHAVGFCRLVNLDGIKDPASFYWNNRNKCTVDYSKQGAPSLPEFLEKTGLNEMKLKVKNALNIKSISFCIDKSNIKDLEKYNILAGIINPKLKDSCDFKYDIKKQEVTLIFHDSISGENIELLSLITHYKKDNQNEYSKFKVSNISIKDEHSNDAYWTLDDIAGGPNQLNIEVNPLDLNLDTWIDQKDMIDFFPHFGKKLEDKDFDPKFDVYPHRVYNDDVTFKQGDGRIDLLDFLELQREIERQDKLLEIVKEQNPDFQKNQTIFTPKTLTPTFRPLLQSFFRVEL